MNKTLLFLMAAAAGAASASGQFATPVIYENASFQGISADGRYVLSELYGVVVVYDRQEGTETVFGGDDENYYCFGIGNCITADGGLIVGSTREDSNAAYYDGSEWKLLDVPSPERTNLSNAITPDGKRVCGSVGVREMSINEDVLMQAPAYWDLQADGTFGECHLLPHPDTDFFGATPQYITAVNISDDGKTIVGQVVDCRGMMVVPIVYTQAENGEWSYSFPTFNLFNPEGIPAVENPGEGPKAPSEEDFMTEEEIAARNVAYQEWIAHGYNDANYPYPEYESYMTQEEIAAFQAAYETWNAENQIWNEKYSAWNDYYFGVTEVSPSFVFNNVSISADGKKIALTVETSEFDPASYRFISIYTPWEIDLATGGVVKYENAGSILAKGITANGTILGSTPIGAMPMAGYLMRDGQVTSLIDYITSISLEAGGWIRKNMTHEIMTGYDYDEDLGDWVETYEEMTFTGIPVATPDLSVIAFWNDCPWDYSSFAMGVVCDLTIGAGVADVAADNGVSAAVDADGNLTVASDVVSVSVYDLAGSLVASELNPAGTVSLGLVSGVYVVKAVRADGSADVVKISL